MAATEPLLIPTDLILNLPSSLPQSFDAALIYQHHDNDLEDEPSLPNPPSSSPPPPSSSSAATRKKMQRSKTAPAMAAMKDCRSHHATDPNLQSDSSSLVRQAALLLVLYLSLGVVIYFVEDFDMVDSVYLSFKTVEGRLFASIWLLYISSRN